MFRTIAFVFVLGASAARARPSVLQEQNLGYCRAFLQGTYVGYETLLALMGYYESGEVKQGIEAGEIIVNAEENEEDRTHISLVGLGLGRTGTTSLVVALEMLGYYVVHDDEHTELTDLYHGLEEEEIDIDEFHEILGLRGYNATFVTVNYEWVQSHPEVKAILTVRDTPEKYVQSWSVAAPFIELLEQIPFRWMPTVGDLYESFWEEYKERPTGGNPDAYLNPDVLQSNYVDYIRKVQEAIPSERLLTFNVKQGWEPLCEFIHAPVPKGVPFPHVHTRAKLEGEMLFLRMITWIWPVAFITPLIILKKVLKKRSKNSKEKEL